MEADNRKAGDRFEIESAEIEMEAPGAEPLRPERPEEPEEKPETPAPEQEEPEGEDAGFTAHSSQQTDDQPRAEGGIEVPEVPETLGRVLWAIPWIVFAIAIIAVGNLLFAASMIGLGVIGLREFAAMVEDRRPFTEAAYVTLAAIVLSAHYGTQFQMILFGVLGFFVMFVMAARRENRVDVTLSMATTVFAVVWIGLPLAHAVLLRDLPLHGGALLVDVLVGTFLADTAAYAAGRLFGRRKVAPRLSPNKTLEGYIGGFIGGTFAFWFAGLYQDWLSGMDALAMGACIALIAPAGDLFASMVKRDLGIKDTGRIFGPHGGLIDRLDAALFTIVAGYYLALAFVY
jgi:phosphatidate cytidylyltransferase